MGVDLATYRARIGTFISRRNVCCGDEKHSPVNVTRRWRGKDVSKVSDRGSYQDNLKCFVASMSLCLEKWSFTLDVHICANLGSRSSEQIYRAAGKLKVLLTLVVTSVMSIRQLLILSGDVEVNPGPIGRHGEDTLDVQCSQDHMYKIASFESFNLKAVARRLIGPQLTKDIIGNEGLSEQDKRDEVFEKWLEMKGPKATYRELVNIFDELKNIEAAEAVRKLTTSYAQSDSTRTDRDSTNTKIDPKKHNEPSTAPPLITTSVKGPDSDTKIDSKEHIEPSTASVKDEEVGHSADSSFTPKNIHSALKDLVDWKPLAIQLEMKTTKIEEIDVNNCGRVADCRREMIQFWLQSDISCSWQKLIGALKSTDQSVLAEEIKSKYCPMFQDSPQITPGNSSTTRIPIPGESPFTTKLKGRYRNYKPAEVDFPPVPTFSFTNLALVKDITQTHRSQFFYNTIQGSMDDVVETKVTIFYKDLMESITPKNRIILLEGRPGCGKTTLMRKLSKDWGEGAILTFVKYLFLIPLRQFYATPIEGLGCVLEYFHMTNLEDEINRNEGENTCFVFDGLDEYSRKYTEDGHLWFEELLRGDILTSSTVIITSRPNASLELRKSVHTRGEVLGFLKEQIDQYIDTSYPTDPSKATEVKAYLHDHQNIRHMCYIPLHLVMIIFIYDTSQEESTPLPNTETEVYQQFTIMSLVRYFRKYGREIKIKDLTLLPLPELALFRGISKLAYTTTAALKAFILLEEVMLLGGEWSTTDIANLGILVMDKKEGRSGAESIFSFVHLTNQEFLAAYHVSRLPPDEQLKAIREHVVQPHMGVVLKFFCGLTKLQNDDHWSVIMNSALIDEYGDKKVNLLALHCVFESQNHQRCRELFAKAEGKLVNKNETLTLLDYCAVGCCMGAANNLVKEIELRCQLTAEGLDIITEKLTNTMDSVRKFRIGGDLYEKDILVALKKFISKYPKVESLDLYGCFRKRGCSDWSLLGDILKEIPHLQTLLLWDNNIGDEGIKALSTAACHWTNLQKLDLGNSNLGDGSIDSLVQIISHCPLKTLWLNNSSFDTKWANHFTADSKDTLRAAAMSIVLSLPEEDSDVRGVVSPPADQSDEDEDYSWVQQLDDFLSTEGTKSPQQSSSPPPPSSD